MDRDKERLEEYGSALLIKIRNANLAIRRELAVLLTPLYQGMSNCGRCDLPWNVVEGHTTDIDEFEGCFPLCEKCWEELLPEDRLFFYEVVFNEWRMNKISRKEATPEKWQKIKAAVLAGK